MKRLSILLLVALATLAVPTHADTMPWSGTLSWDVQSTDVRDGIEYVITVPRGEQPTYDLGTFAVRPRTECVFRRYDYDNDGNAEHIILGYVYDNPLVKARCVPYVRRGNNRD